MRLWDGMMQRVWSCFVDIPHCDNLSPLMWYFIHFQLSPTSQILNQSAPSFVFSLISFGSDDMLMPNIWYNATNIGSWLDDCNVYDDLSRSFVRFIWCPHSLTQSKTRRIHLFQVLCSSLGDECFDCLLMRDCFWYQMIEKHKMLKSQTDLCSTVLSWIFPFVLDVCSHRNHGIVGSDSREYWSPKLLGFYPVAFIGYVFFVVICDLCLFHILHEGYG